MAKTLSESAAEILKASMNAGKEQMNVLPDEVNDLGGATNDNPGGTVNEPPTAEAPKPGQSNTESPEKKIGSVKSQGLAKPAAMDATLNPSLGEETDSEDEYVISEEEVEQVDEAKIALPPGVRVRKENMPDDDYASEQHTVYHKNRPIGSISNTPGEGHIVVHQPRDPEGDEKITVHRTHDSALKAILKTHKLTEEVSDLSEEDILEAKKKMMKEMVRKHKGTMKEDVDALFNGESLSEDFRVKATLIFESAVQSRVESILEGVLADNDKLLSEAVSEIKTEMAEQVDSYLNYVVEEWMTENKIAIESGLRAELSEDFINGLKNLFAEHYVEIPEEKLDVAEELAARVVELEEAAEAAAAETAALSEELNAVKKDEAIRKICEGLTEVQIGKMKSLAESVEFTTEGDFDHKLAVIRENYFPSKVQVKSEVKAIQEAAADEAPEEVVQASGIMAHYVKSLTKTAPKA